MAFLTVFTEGRGLEVNASRTVLIEILRYDAPRAPVFTPLRRLEAGRSFLSAEMTSERKLKYFFGAPRAFFSIFFFMSKNPLVGSNVDVRAQRPQN